MQIYPLSSLLSSVANAHGKKRLLFDPAPLGGISNRLIIAFFILLPVLEYGIFFNSYVFKILGIATAIVAYIVCLSLIMITVFLVTWRVNYHIIKKITPSWEFYFPQKPLEIVLSSRVSPYSDFFDYYTRFLEKESGDIDLETFLLNAFGEMEDKNKELLEAINRNKQLLH